MKAQAAMGENLTSYYQTLLQAKAQLTNDEVKALQQYHFVMVRGFLGEFIKMGEQKYFDDQVKIFERYHISYSIAGVRSKFDEATNAKLIGGQLYSYILEAAKPVVLLTHSRGGLIVLRSLLNNPSLRTQVAGWIALQSPFDGVTFADNVASNVWTRAFATLYLNYHKIDADMMYEFTHNVRLNFMKQNTNQISQLLREMPIITYGSQITGLPPHHPDYLKDPSRGPFFIEGTDGLVDFDSTYIRGAGTDVAAHVTEQGIDHLGLVSDVRTSFKGRELRTYGLLKLLLQQMR